MNPEFCKWEFSETSPLAQAGPEHHSGATEPAHTSQVGRCLLQKLQVVCAGGLEGPCPGYLAPHSALSALFPSSNLSHIPPPEICCTLTNKATTASPHFLGPDPETGWWALLTPSSLIEQLSWGATPGLLGPQGQALHRAVSNALIMESRYPMAVEGPPGEDLASPTHSHMASRE